MPAYVISEVEIRDPVAMEDYRRLAAASIAQYGGRYLVRGGAAEAVEGGRPPKGLIIVEFPSMARAGVVRLGGVCAGAAGPADGT